ncbi:MAG: hypothetical protein M3442_15280, partial [Chloroflexota bacterium]|nr:hypothetical protein [Chloroflexota bacterium]
AHEREREIVDEAELQAQQIRDEADQYAFQILDNLNRTLGPILSQVQAGIDALRPTSVPSAPRNSESRATLPVVTADEV